MMLQVYVSCRGIPKCDHTEVKSKTLAPTKLSMLALLLLSLAARCAVALLVAPVAPYLVHWRYGKSGAHEYFSSQFRQEEFRSLAALAGAEPTSITFSNAIAGSGEDAEAIQWISGLPTEAVAAAICRRAVCVRALHTLLAEGADLKSCADEAGKLPTDSPELAPLMAGSSAVSTAHHHGASIASTTS
jgi:hypothetical protein